MGRKFKKSVASFFAFNATLRWSGFLSYLYLLFELKIDQDKRVIVQFLFHLARNGLDEPIGLGHSGRRVVRPPYYG